MHYQIIYYKVISDDCVDDVIADRISFEGECEASKISLWLTKFAQYRGKLFLLL